MKSFHFPLESVLAWRKTRMEAEEAEMGRLAAGLEAVRNQIRETEEAGARAVREVYEAPTATALQLWTLDGYRVELRTQVQVLGERERAAEQQWAAQREKAQAVRRQYRLLENLKQRRWEEWQAEAAREVENFAGDSYLARWNREARRQARATARPRRAEPGGKAPL